MQSEAGRLLNRASDLRFALDAGFTITLNDVTTEVYQALRTFETESARHQRQQQAHGNQVSSQGK